MGVWRQENTEVVWRFTSGKEKKVRRGAMNTACPQSPQCLARWPGLSWDLDIVVGASGDMHREAGHSAHPGHPQGLFLSCTCSGPLIFPNLEDSKALKHSKHTRKLLPSPQLATGPGGSLETLESFTEEKFYCELLPHRATGPLTGAS